MGKINHRLRELDIELVNLPFSSEFSLIPVQQTGNLLFISGHDCRKNGELIYQGKLGDDLTVAQGYESAYQCMINLLSSMREAIGDLDKVKKIVKILGFVNSAPGFTEQSYVLNGASDLLENVFESNGKHARSAIGVNELSFNTPIEIEMIVEVHNHI